MGKTALKLSSGYEMPIVGYGIWKVPRENATQSVYEAIKMGYRHIDGAYDYTNSTEAGKGVQKAISEGIVKREDLFVTSKLWCNYKKHDIAIEMAKDEVNSWGIGYLDLYLIHFPVSIKYIPPTEIKWPCWWSDKEQKTVSPLDPVPISETWSALESLVKTDANPNGILRSIGVANFSAQLLYDLLSYAKIKPAVNQIELHPYLVQQDLVDMCQSNNIAVTAYSSFGPASFVELDHALTKTCPSLFTQDAVTVIAKKHGKTPAQVLLRWATQRDIIVIPKSNSASRLKENLESTGFDLDKDELAQISALNNGTRFNNPKDAGVATIFA